MNVNLDERPHVTLSAAVTADGKTDTVERRGAQISSPEDAERLDRLRAASHAVTVGGSRSSFRRTRTMPSTSKPLPPTPGI